MNTRRDGGPTSWEGYIVTGDRDGKSYREFALEFQDSQLAYDKTSRIAAGNERFRPRGNPDRPAAFDVGARRRPDPRRDPRLHRHPQPRQDPREFPAGLPAMGFPLTAVAADGHNPGTRGPSKSPGALNAGMSYASRRPHFHRPDQSRNCGPHPTWLTPSRPASSPAASSRPTP